MDGDAELPAGIGGLRTVRVLAAGPRSRIVLLQHPDGVVAKVWSAATDRADIDRELAAIARVAHPHVLRLLDVETLPDGRVAALLPRLGRGSVLRLLERRDGISLGEAITLLAPIAAAIDALHTAGVVHGGLTAARILLDDAGAPILVGFRAATFVTRGLSPAARAELVADDERALLVYADRVLDLCTGDDTAAAAEIRRVVAVTPAGTAATALIAALFAAGTGEALRFPSDETAMAVGSGRVLPARTGARGRGVASTPAVSPGALVPIAAGLDSGWSGARRVARERWRSMPRARRLALVGVAAAVSAAVSAAVLVPGPEPEDAAPSTPVSSPASPSGGGRTSPAPGTSPDEAVVEGEDPVAAAAVLLPTRERCIREQDLGCLATVDEPGSAIESSDREVIAGSTDVALPAEPLRHVDRIGDAAIVEAAAHRILLMRTASGWRLREIVASEGVVTP